MSTSLEVSQVGRQQEAQKWRQESRACGADPTRTRFRDAFGVAGVRLACAGARHDRELPPLLVLVPLERRQHLRQVLLVVLRLQLLHQLVLLHVKYVLVFVIQDSYAS